jgi:hypothetical protein
MVDQMINVSVTDKSPNQRNGEEKLPCKKKIISERVLISTPLSGMTLFLKQKCVRVSSTSVKRRINNILRVSLFLNIVLKY